MSRFFSPQETHPLGESLARSKAPGASWAVDSPGGRGHPTARQCHGKVPDGARRLGRPFRARCPFWPESQGVALGWRRPRRWRSELRPMGRIMIAPRRPDVTAPSPPRAIPAFGTHGSSILVSWQNGLLAVTSAQPQGHALQGHALVFDAPTGHPKLAQGNALGFSAQKGI